MKYPFYWLLRAFIALIQLMPLTLVCKRTPNPMFL